MRYNVYFGANEARRTNLSRAAAVKHYNLIRSQADKAEENIYIYCPTTDSYVSDWFLDAFLNEQSTFGKLMFEDNAQLLSKEAENTYKWNRNGEIILSTPDEIKILKKLNN